MDPDLDVDNCIDWNSNSGLIIYLGVEFIRSFN